MNKIVFLSIFFVIIFLYSCDSNKTYKNKLQVHHEHLEPQDLEIKYYNKVLFDIDTTDFSQGLKAIQSEYPVFLEGNLNDANSINYLKSFVSDTFCVRLNDIVEQRFSDMKKINNDIKYVYQRLNYYYPEINLSVPVYYYVSGIDYEMSPVMLTHQGVLISLDYYLGSNDKIYDYIGMPRFRSLRCHPSYITRDLAQSFYYYFVENQYAQKDMITEMIKLGKMNYFVEAMDPSLPDSVILGYSSKQMAWAQQHEGDVWASLVGNDMLYSKGLDMYRSFFGDGPFTQAFSDEAPPRLGEFIGLQIIRSYMTNNDVSLQQLIDNDDAQQIFQSSQYKPRKGG